MQTKARETRRTCTGIQCTIQRVHACIFHALEVCDCLRLDSRCFKRVYQTCLCCPCCRLCSADMGGAGRLGRRAMPAVPAVGGCSAAHRAARRQLGEPALELGEERRRLFPPVPDPSYTVASSLPCSEARFSFSKPCSHALMVSLQDRLLSIRLSMPQNWPLGDRLFRTCRGPVFRVLLHYLFTVHDLCRSIWSRSEPAASGQSHRVCWSCNRLCPDQLAICQHGSRRPISPHSADGTSRREGMVLGLSPKGRLDRS